MEEDVESLELALKAAREVNAFLNAENAILTERLRDQAQEIADLRELVSRLRSAQAAGPSSPEGPSPISATDKRFEKLRVAAAASGCLARDPEHDIVLGAKLGEGSSGETWRGQWRGADAAIKMVRVDTASRVVCFLREVEILSKLRHPNILPFLCASLVRPSHCWIVAEHMPGGTLKAWLYKDGVCQRTPQQRLSAAQDVAHGLEYLHSNSPPILHRDIKPSNVFLDHSGSFRIADFGLARFLAPAGEVMTGETGTYLYMAPEVIRHEEYGLAADVFSYGVLLAELISGHRPYSDDPLHLKAAQIALAVAAGKLSPAVPADATGPLRDLVTSCCSLHPKKRPAISTAVGVIQKEIVVMSEKQASSSGGLMKYIWG